MEMHFEVVLIAAVRNFVFVSLNLCYILYLNLLF